MPKVRGRILTMYESSFQIKAAKLWNKIPGEITNIDSLTLFKKKLNEYLLLYPDKPPITGYLPYKQKLNIRLPNHQIMILYLTFLSYILQVLDFPKCYILPCILYVFVIAERIRHLFEKAFILPNFNYINHLSGMIDCFVEDMHILYV